MPDTAERSAIAACSFCLKPSTEVATLVAGPGVYICNECVALSTQLIDSKPPTESKSPTEGEAAPAPQVASWDLVNNVEEVLAALPRMAAVRGQVEQTLTGWVRRARVLGATWARIGEALGMTRQSAWERFSGEE
jgi:ATP-dependent protease Clp ATPase subunit